MRYNQFVAYPQLNFITLAAEYGNAETEDFMKKSVLMLSCALLFGSLTANAAKDINVSLNGNPLTFDSQPIIKNDRTFVPMRKIFEDFGMKVEWDNNTKTICAKGNDSEISLSIGSNEMWVDGKCITLDAVPFIQNDRTLVPLRAISEALKCSVKWDPDNFAVIIIGAINAKPTATPTLIPSQSPSVPPAAVPTTAPTQLPTAQPTAVPTQNPTAEPTSAPTQIPTAEPTSAPTQAPTAAPAGEKAMEQEVLRLVNQARTENGLNTLAWADDLADIARAHSADMIKRSFFSHTNPDGQSPFDRIKNNGISYRAAAENIAYGQPNAASVMNSWMNSSGHRANILNANLKEIGIGAVKNSSGTVYWTQVFISR